MRIRLEDEAIRRELLKGRFPRITRPGDKPCPYAVGDTYYVSATRTLVVTEIRRSRFGEWVLVYEVRKRERPLFLASGAPSPENKKGKRMSQSEARRKFSDEQARGYCHSRSQSMDSLETVDFRTLTRIVDESRYQNEVREMVLHPQRKLEQEIIRKQEKLRKLQAEARRKAIDITPELSDAIRAVNEKIMQHKRIAA